ncbi:LysR family transcriptional regulator [Bradyrhizobium manausense]
METRFLQTFVVVVETSSLAEAARKLNITPSAVVQRVRALESEIGCKLIHRAGHSMRPTAAGAAIFAEATRIVKAARDLNAIAVGDLEVGGLTVGVFNTAMTGILPDVLSALKRNRPGIDVYIVRGQSADLYRRLVLGELDLAIAVKPHFKLPKTLDWRLLREEPLVMLVPEHMDARDSRAILSKQPFIRQDRNHWGGRVVDRYLRKMKIQPNEQYELDSLEAIAVMVDRGLGVSILPDWPPPWPEGLKIRKIRIPNAPRREIGLLSQRSSPREWLIRAFVNEATAALADRKVVPRNRR